MATVPCAVRATKGFVSRPEARLVREEDLARTLFMHTLQSGWSVKGSAQDTAPLRYTQGFQPG
jgi:hypothetical protein